MKHIRRILSYTGTLWRYYVAVSLFTILLAGMSQLQPLLTKGAIDEVTKLISGGTADVTLVATLAVLIFLTDFGQTIFGNISGYLGDLLAIKLKQLLSSRYYEHLMGLPQRYFDRELTGTIANRMNRGIQDIGDFVQMFSNNFLQFVFSTVFTLIIVAYYSWPVALLLLLLYPIFIWMTTKTSSKWQSYQKQINEDMDRASGRFTETVLQIKVVKSFTQEKRELGFFQKYMQRAVKTVKPQSKYWHIQDVRRRAVLALIFFTVFIFIFVQTARGVYTIGEMVLLIQYSTLIRLPIFSISFLVDRTQRAIANSKDYFEVMDVKPEVADRPDAKPLAITQGEIVYDAVSFAYDSETVLKNLSCTIRPHSKLALVGESGEGKTTVTNLLLRLYEPKKGRILIDGQDISRVTQKSLREQIGVVFQDPALFSGTIYENITYASPKASEKQVLAAAKAANVDEFVSKLKKGYQTEIGERGLKLSGGQKQRIAIARAIYKNADLILLDEPFNELDECSEMKMLEHFKQMAESGKIILLITHNKRALERCHKTISLDEQA